MSVMFNQDPFVVAVTLEFFAGGGKIEPGITCAELAETETLGPSVKSERGILDEDILEVDADNAIVIFSDDLDVVAECPCEVPDVKQEAGSGNRFEKIFQLLLAFNPGAEMVVQGSFKPETLRRLDELIGAAAEYIKIDIASAGTGCEPDIFLAERGCLFDSESDLIRRNTAGCEVHPHLAVGGCFVDCVRRIADLKPFRSVESD